MVRERGRKSKDKVLNGNGKKLLKSLEEIECFILNGNIEGGEKGEQCLGGEKATVIDYVIIEEMRKVKRIEVDYIYSDHFPIEVTSDVENSNIDLRKRSKISKWGKDIFLEGKGTK